jgi:hypothetical protein
MSEKPGLTPVALALVAAGVLCSATPMAQMPRIERLELTWTRESGWGTYCVLDVSLAREGRGRARMICHTAPHHIVNSRRIEVAFEGDMVLEPSDVERLIDIAARADLFDGRYAGRDSRGGDGAFDRLQVTLNRGRTAILVTSGNPSFHGEDEARTQLLQELTCVEARVRAHEQSVPLDARCRQEALR